jgi:hypothetical protein
VDEGAARQVLGAKMHTESSSKTHIFRVARPVEYFEII